MGRTIEVEYNEKLDDSTGAFGRVLFRKNKVILQPSTDSVGIHHTSIEESFLHELVHWIFFMLSEDKDLGSNEKLVDGIAALLHQALTTMEYLNE